MKREYINVGIVGVIINCGGILIVGKISKNKDILSNDDELKKLYDIYLRVQQGEKKALNELFMKRYIDDVQEYKAAMRHKKRRFSNMDNVLDSELVLANEEDNEKTKREDEWTNSIRSKVIFQLPCLNKMLYAKKKKFLQKTKIIDCGDNKTMPSGSCSKFYEGEYDVSDFNELVYETIIEVFYEKTDEDNCLTLDGKRNEKYPICNGISLLRNISYFTSRKINKRAEKTCLDVSEMGFYGQESKSGFSYLDKKSLKEFQKIKGGVSRLSIYAEYLEWLKRNDLNKLFKANACDIQAIIETVMNHEDVFMEDIEEDMELGTGMRFVTQEMLQEIIKNRHNINIEQENISKDLEIIEQRLLDHLFYSLNYRIGKAEKSNGIYENESKRFLYQLDNRAYVKMFGRMSCSIYDESKTFINSNISGYDFDNYFRLIKRYEDMIMEILYLEAGKKKYDMVNLVLGNNDLVDDKTKTLLDIANTVIMYYQEKEKKYINDKLSDYIMRGLADWGKSYWEAELQGQFMNIKLWTNRNVKKPIRHCINKEKLMIYCGYVNFYFCDVENKVCYRVPKDKRIISRANKNHEIFMYNVG